MSALGHSRHCRGEQKSAFVRFTPRYNHLEGGRFTADEIARKLAALMNEEGLLRAMWEVGYFPPDTPPPNTIAGN
jgi:hypothetical protein